MALAEAQDNLNHQLRSRTDLEVFLRQALEDVRLEIARKTNQNRPKESFTLPALQPSVSGTIEQAANSVSVHELQSTDRERVLEILFSQQRAIQLLYDKTFPISEGEERAFPAESS